MDLSGLFLSTHLDRFWYFVPECDISSNQSLFQRSRKRPFTQPMVSDRCNEWPHSQRFLQASLPAFLLFGFFPVCLMQRFFNSLESSCRSAVWYSLCSALVSAAAGQSNFLRKYLLWLIHMRGTLAILKKAATIELSKALRSGWAGLSVAPRARAQEAQVKEAALAAGDRTDPVG